MTGRTAGVLVALAALAAAAAPSAAAAPLKPDLRVAPAAPTRSSPITVSWRAPVKGRYGVTLTIRPASRTRLACSYGASSTANGVTAPVLSPGPRRRVVLKPSGDPEETRKWCTGPATVTLRRFTANSGPPQTVATRRVTIRRGPGELTPGPADTPASIRLLAGSTIMLSSAGQPDRTTPVNGVLRGLIPSPFFLGRDVNITRAGGALVPVDLRTPASCPSPGQVGFLGLRPATSMALAASGKVTLTLVFNGSPPEITGCGVATPTERATTVTLTGQSGAKGLLALNLDGARDGITLHLLVHVDLSDRT